MPDEQLRGIVSRMVAAGESEDAIGAVIQRYQQTRPQGTAPEEKSVGGFFGNLVSSTGKLIGDTVQGVAGLAQQTPRLARFAMGRPSGEDIQAASSLVQAAPSMPGAIKDAVMDRYGSLDAIGNTLYNDPAGVLADVSTLASGGAMAAGRAPRLASALTRTADAVNPLRAVAAPVGKAMKEAGNLTVRATLRPSAKVRKDFGGGRQVAQNVIDEGVVSQPMAERRLAQSVSDADELLAAKEAAGTAGVPKRALADSVVDGPTGKAAIRAKLGAPDQTDALWERAAAIERANPGDEIPLTSAQAMKREAQQMAYEAGENNLSVQKEAEEGLARALRSGIESRVPEVGPINQRSQRLLSAERAFGEAAERPSQLSHILSVMSGAGGLAMGNPLVAVGTPLAIQALKSPRAGAAAGIALDRAGRVGSSAELARAALLARLLGSDQ